MVILEESVKKRKIVIEDSARKVVRENSVRKRKVVIVVCYMLIQNIRYVTQL